MADPMLSMDEIAARVGVGRTTLYRALGRASRAGAMAGSGAEMVKRKSRSPGRKPRASSPATAT
jgi:transposase